jgi:hypothetical protein
MRLVCYPTHSTLSTDAIRCNNLADYKIIEHDDQTFTIWAKQRDTGREWRVSKLVRVDFFNP